MSIAVEKKPVLAWDYRDGDDIGPDSPSAGTANATADDTAVVTGRLTGGAPFVLTGTWSVFNGSGNRLEIYGSEGTAVLEEGTLKAAKRGENFEKVVIPAAYTLDTAAGPRLIPASSRLFEDVAAVVDGRRDPEDALFARIEDGYKVQEVMEVVRARGERIISPNG